VSPAVTAKPVPVRKPPAPPPPPANLFGLVPYPAPPPPPPAMTRYSTSVTPVGHVQDPDCLKMAIIVLLKFQLGFAAALVSAALICGFNPRLVILVNDAVLKPILGYLCTKDAE
jgi:hypothetical protein